MWGDSSVSLNLSREVAVWAETMIRPPTYTRTKGYTPSPHSARSAFITPIFILRSGPLRPDQQRLSRNGVRAAPTRGSAINVVQLEPPTTPSTACLHLPPTSHRRRSGSWTGDVRSRPRWGTTAPLVLFHFSVTITVTHLPLVHWRARAGEETPPGDQLLSLPREEAEM